MTVLTEAVNNRYLGFGKSLEKPSQLSFV